MKKIYLLLLLAFISNVSASTGPDKIKFTGTNYFLKNLDNTVSIPVGNYLAGYNYTLNITLPAGLYYFSPFWSGGSGVPNTSGPGFFSGSLGGGAFNLPAGVYNIHVNFYGGTYNIVAVTPWMLVWRENTVSLTDMGDGTYCATDLTFSNCSGPAGPYCFTSARFYTSTNGTTGFGMVSYTSFPSGPLVSGTTIEIPNGTYDVCVNLQNMSINFVNKLLSTGDVASRKVAVYPNPTTNQWNFTLGNDPVSSVKIYNSLGKLVAESMNLKDDFSIDASSLASGVYFAHVLTEKDTSILKLVKK